MCGLRMSTLHEILGIFPFAHSPRLSVALTKKIAGKMNVTEEEFFRDIDQDMELLSAQLDMDPVVTPEMLAQTPIEVTEVSRKSSF